MDRLDLAYALIALTTLAVAVFIARRVYYGRERAMRRRHAAELAAHRDVLAAKIRNR